MCRQIDKIKFHTRERFAKAIVNAFNEAEDKVYVDYWACCLEPRKERGEHFHLCVKLIGPKRWKPIKESLSNKHGVVLQFFGKHDNHYTTLKYVIKI